MIRKFVGVVLLVVAVATACGADWREVYQSDFEKPGWEAAWSLKGSAGPTDQGALVSGGKEMFAALNKTFLAPGVRAEYDATFTATGPDGEVSDLSCFLGGVLFQVGGHKNTRTRIVRGQGRVHPMVAAGRHPAGRHETGTGARRGACRPASRAEFPRPRVSAA